MITPTHQICCCLMVCLTIATPSAAEEIPAPAAVNNNANNNANGFDLHELRTLTDAWRPTFSEAWRTATSLHSAVHLGPTWSDAACVGNDFLKDHPGVPLPTLEALIPSVKIVTDVVNQEEITVPSNVMYVRFSKPFLKKYFCKSIDERSAIRDTILGASCVGTRRTIGSTELILLQDPNQARTKIRFVGANHFTSRSYKQQVSVHSRGKTQFSSEVILTFDGTNVSSSPAVTRADTDTTTTGITTSLPGLRRRIALKVATREEAASHAQAESITSERTKAQVEKGFEKRVGEGLAMFTEELQTQYAKLPLEGRFALQEIRCNTTPHMLEIVLIGRGEHAPNFADAPLFLKGAPDIEFQIHTSLVQKAILDPELRATLQSAVMGLVDRPVMTLVSSARKSQHEKPERELKIHWLEGEGQWLAMAWHAAEENSQPPTKAPVTPRARITVGARP